MLTLKNFIINVVPSSFSLHLNKAKKIIFIWSCLIIINFYDACVYSISNQTLPPISTSLKHSRYYAQSHELSNGIFNTFTTYISLLSLFEEHKHSKFKTRRNAIEFLKNKKFSFDVGNSMTGRILFFVSILANCHFYILSPINTLYRSCTVVDSIHAGRVK